MDEFWSESLEDDVTVGKAHAHKAQSKVRWEMARESSRDIWRRLRTGSGASPNLTNGNINPNTGNWYSYSIPGAPGSLSGDTFYPMPG